MTNGEKSTPETMSEYFRIFFSSAAAATDPAWILLDVRLSECVRTASIPGELPTRLPWYLRHANRPHFVSRAQGMWPTSCQCARADSVQALELMASAEREMQFRAFAIDVCKTSTKLSENNHAI